MNISLTQQLTDYIQAGYSCFYLQTAETAQAEQLVEEVANQLKFNVLEYNLAQGKVDFKTKELQKDYQGRLDSALQELLDEDLENSLILIRNAKLALENQPLAIARLQYLVERIERHTKAQCAVILQSAEVYIPADLEPFITLLEMPLPDEQAIKALIQAEYPQIPDELLSPISISLSGLNGNEIKKLITLIQHRFHALTSEHQPQILAEILHQKEQIIAKSGVLEMVKVKETIEDIGGLENLKKWLQEQSQILSQLEEATKFGVKAPKGALIAGMPGCGKSLTAKAAAQLFQQPLLRLDIGSLLGKYVGESETNMRRALAMAESISPCVLWVDELEKAFVGMSGNNASEVSSRLLGYFLTWLQEKTKPVFIIATANDITALPPELLRKGRFDEIFYVGFPNQIERKKILEIHLTKAKQNVAEFNLAELAQRCRDFAGADIENAVYESVKNAFLSPEKQLTQEKIKAAIAKTTPLRKTLKEKVGEYEQKFDELYLTPASKNEGLSIAQMVKMAKDPNYLARKKVAESEEVTEEILEDLVKDKELDVRKAAFANINCPTKLLDEQISLKSDHQLYNKEIFEIIVKHSNVSFPLAVKLCKHNNAYIDELVKNADLSLEENQIALMETEYTREILATVNEIVIDLQEKLTSDIRKELASNSNITEEIQRVLAKDSDKDVRIALARNSNIPEEIQRILVKDSDGDVRRSLAINSNIPEEIQHVLVKDSDGWVRGGLAINSNIPAEIQRILAQDSDKDVREALARSNIPEEILLILVKDSDKIVRMALAINSNIPEEIQRILVKDSDKIVRMALAMNSNIPAEIQRILAEDSDKDVREALARSNIPEEIQRILAEDSNADVRKALSGNSNITEKVQLILAEDRDEDVRAALARSNIPEEIQRILVRDSDQWVRRGLAGNSNISEEIQRILAEDSDEWVRRALAINSNIPEEIQRILVRDSDQWVRRSLAINSNIPEEIQRILVKDSDGDVRNGLAVNSNIPKEIQRILAKDSDKDVRIELARNSNIPEEIQRILAADSDADVRRGLAGNSNITAEIQYILAKDSYEYVRKALVKNPKYYANDKG